MCGIVGSLSFEGADFDVTEPYLVRMRDTMTHRGPDGAGVWVSPDRRVGLAHRRLAIIDLSAAADQPMSNEDGTVWTVFNGEIYNHAEIRAELERTGRHTWRTDHSDTEVIVHAYEEWGTACLERFRGMFAFAIWDARTRELWLVRDRIGIKPLYYSIHHGRITFASEIKALLVDPDQERGIDHEAFYHYLSFLTTPAPQTLFRGIRKLAGGTWLRVLSDGTVREQRWWDVWDHAQPITGLSDGEYGELVLQELRTAVHLRKEADVPVGVFLSGGVDSSTNAALFSENEDEPISTFTIGYEGEYESYRNELDYARLMANEVKAKHHELMLTPDHLIDFLPRMIELQDEPIADPVCVPVYYVAKLARDNGVTVCQVGEGADELFWGYWWWKSQLRLQQIDDLPVPRSLKKLGTAALRAASKDRGLRYEFLRRGAAGVPVFWGGAEAFTEQQKRRLLSSSLGGELKGLTSWDALAPIRSRFEANAWEPSHLHWMSYIDLNLRLPELLLMRIDKMSMGVSLEGRVPFLDHRLVELTLSIPEAVKIRGGESKYLLKRAVRGLIPDELIDRQKQGFAVPIQEWFHGRLGEIARSELDTFCGETGLLDHREVTDLLDTGAGPQAWYLLNLALWWREYML